MKKAKGMSTGKRGKSMQSMVGNKSTFTMYTGNIVQSGKGMSGMKKGMKPAKPGKTT